jgi:hypothetical protein
MDTAEKKSQRRRFTGRDYLIVIFAVALVAFIVYRFVAPPVMRLMSQLGEPPILVGDGSITFEHAKGVQPDPSNGAVIEVKKVKKAVSFQVVEISTGTAGPKTLLKDGWSLTTGGTPTFKLGRAEGTDPSGNKNETYTATCPVSWAGSGSKRTCAVQTKFFPALLHDPTGDTPLTCSDQNGCQLRINFK